MSKDYLTTLVVVPLIYVLIYHVLIKYARASKENLKVSTVVPVIYVLIYYVLIKYTRDE